MTENNIIEIKDLSFAYGNESILSHINCEIKDKELVSIVGPNGGGKTTLVRLMAGLLYPVKGKVYIEGVSTTERHPIVGYVSQNSMIDDKFPVTVQDIVLSGTMKSGFGFYNKNDRKKANSALESVGMSNFVKKRHSDLSGGQRKRVIIARALAGGAKILLLDEPTANLDANSSADLIELIKDLNKTITVVLVTHDYGFVSDITNRVFCINNHLHEHPLKEAEERFAMNLKRVDHTVVLNKCKGCEGKQ
ncbi:MAG TPA: ABC transporter ATP-binding protein [Spirochaetota bacterium]|nr:ABC transporter ATP-binding protein [Spirochaetota bacterium]